MTDSTEGTMQIENVPDFWERLSASRTRFLGLDYDGTLAPFHEDPMQAKPLPGVLDLLRTLAGESETSLAIVSGRPVAEVSKLLKNLPVTLVGSHGFELQRPEGKIQRIGHLSDEQREGLGKAKGRALERGYGPKLEYKMASIALHTRGLDPRLASAMEEAMYAEWSALAGPHGLECRRFNGGVEIRCAGWHKGDAVSELLQLEPSGVFPVYVGDDETDEDVFRMIRERGVGIKVGRSSYSTAAEGFLEDCRAVRKFLEAWISITSTIRR